MTNRFDHITSQKQKSEAALHPQAPTVASKVKGKPKLQRIGRDAYDTLMGLLSEDVETPLTPYGVFIANSTKRSLKRQVEGIFQP
jgi:hypothetical protein